MQKEELTDLLLKEIQRAKTDFATKKVSDLECTTSAEFLNSIKSYYNYYSLNNDDSYIVYIKERLEIYRASTKSSTPNSKANTYQTLIFASRGPAVLCTIFGLLTGNLALMGVGGISAGIMLYALRKLKQEAEKPTNNQKKDVLSQVDEALLKTTLLENRERILPELKY